MDWLRDAGPVSTKIICREGWKSVWNGDTKKRLLASGAVIGINLPGKTRRFFVYKKPYVRKIGGVKKGFKLPARIRKAAQIKAAITFLTKNGYEIKKCKP